MLIAHVSLFLACLCSHLFSSPHNVRASVTQGGFLFQWFIEFNASEYYYKRYRSLLRDEEGFLGQENTDLFVNSLGYKFLGYVCQVLSVNGQSASRQMFFATYAARFHGLSRSGVNMLAAVGCMMPMSSVDRTAKLHHAQSRMELR
jgi:hypothetical protein